MINVETLHGFVERVEHRVLDGPHCVHNSFETDHRGVQIIHNSFVENFILVFPQINDEVGPHGVVSHAQDLVISDVAQATTSYSLISVT